MKYLLIFLLGISALVWAEEEEELSLGSVRAKGNSLYSFSMGTGLHLMDSKLGWSANFGLTRRWSKDIPVLMGIETGMTFWNLQNPNNPFFSNVQLLRILPNVSYYLNLSNLNWIHPFGGVGVGVDIFAGSGTLNPNWISSLKGAQLEVSMRMGIAVDLSESFFVSLESQMGTTGGRLFINPLFNAVLFL